MKYNCLIAAGVFLSVTSISYASAQSFNDVSSIQVILNKYDNVDGSPYLSDTWLQGSVKLANNPKTYTQLLLKYNQEEDNLYFQGEDNTILGFNDPVSEFKINTIRDGMPYIAIYKNGYKNVAGTIVNSFFEVLAGGKTQLLKKTFKTIEETKEYGSAVVQRKLVVNTRYFLYTDGQAIMVKPNEKSILQALNSKLTELKTFIAQNKINFKSDADLSRLIDYYNSI